MSTTTVPEHPSPVSGATKSYTAVKISPPPSPSPSVDIDGIPLRDGQKIDLKQLLGHTPDVEDDENQEAAASGNRTLGEIEASAAAVQLIGTRFQPVDDDELVFGDDDDEGSEDSDSNVGPDTSSSAVEPSRRTRRSSLKRCLLPSTEHLDINAASTSLQARESPEPVTPDHAHKAVRFADAVGLGLADVRDLVNADEPPTIPASALRDLHLRRRKRSKSHLVYSLDFSQPGSDPTFITRVLADKVALENCVACSDCGDQLTVSGVVRVANVAFDKHLTVLYSLDGWLTPGHAVPASYLPGSNDGATDRFAFVLEPPTTATARPGARVEFAVSYVTGGETYWDNNTGANYGVNCRDALASDAAPAAAGSQAAGK